MLDRARLRASVQAAVSRFAAEMAAWVEKQTYGRVVIPRMWRAGLPANTNASPWLDRAGAALHRFPARAAVTALAVVVLLQRPAAAQGKGLPGRNDPSKPKP